MKIKLLIILLSFCALQVGAQTNDVIVTKPVPLTGSNANNQTQSYANLKAYLTLYVPKGNTWTLNGGKDTVGAIRYNTALGKLGVYKGSNNWEVLGGGGTWGSITGNLSDQTDLLTALNARQYITNLSNDLTASAIKYPSVNAVNTGLALKANDNAVVHLSGTEQIYGSKYWYDPALYINSTNTTGIEPGVILVGGIGKQTKYLNTGFQFANGGFELNVLQPNLTTNVTQTFQAKSGNIALLEDITSALGVTMNTTSTTLMLSERGYYNFKGSEDASWTLPSAPATGRFYRIYNKATGSDPILTITAGGTDAFYKGGTVTTSISLMQGENLTIQYDGAGQWNVYGS